MVIGRRSVTNGAITEQCQQNKGVAQQQKAFEKTLRKD